MKQNPNQDGITYVPFPRHVVEAIDTLLEYKFKMRIPDSITSKDKSGWVMVEKLVEIWKIIYPEEYNTFVASQKEKWSNLANDHAQARKDAGTGGVQMRGHVELPQRLYDLIAVMLPYQKWDKDFVIGLAKTIPETRMYKKL